ncbi:BMC domain-containing protein [Photobacterium carnosum]|uniref:BMC domain-containing protein n=1 Tax=Photobacterium carnosum TaxID=2023717 RepID=A0A2N4UVF8_9GAMM|nr:BMC domain-containing protein [Photobacterium carnosum]MCD9541063.1 BMC domain-containing protein [Photobacterium carnosum]PLC59014.1 hypothetical protein CIK00_04255 [Photobacterium carnosum]
MTVSLGVIETIGLTAAIHAADAACKAAGVHLTGYRKAGSGLVSVYFEGEISAVMVAVDSGVDAIRDSAELCMSLVMARPDTSVLTMLTQGCLSKVPHLHDVEKEDMSDGNISTSESVTEVPVISDQFDGENTSLVAVIPALMVPNQKPTITCNKRGSTSKSQGSKK